jgi:flagellin
MAVFSFSSSQLSSAAMRGLTSSSASFNKILAQLASGRRINSASDDAAGLAIASQLSASITSISQSSRNASDAAAALNIADGALGQIQEITGRLEELAMTSANGVYTDDQRGAIQAEYSALTQEIERIGATTSYNGRSLLDGSSISAQVGQNSSLSVGGIDVQSLAATLNSQSVSSQSGAQAALGAIKDFSDQINQQRGGSLGSALSRLDSIQEGLAGQQVAQSQALSQIADADIGAAALDASRNKVLMQYQVALLAKSSQLQSSVINSLIA